MYLYPKGKRFFLGRKTFVNGKLSIHPAYIVGEDGDNYLSFILTHSRMKGKNHPNLPLKDNPNPDDETQAYLRRQLEVSPKTWFVDWVFSKYRMSRANNAKVDYLLSKRRK